MAKIKLFDEWVNCGTISQELVLNYPYDAKERPGSYAIKINLDLTPKQFSKMTQQNVFPIYSDDFPTLEGKNFYFGTIVQCGDNAPIRTSIISVDLLPSPLVFKTR